MGSMHRLFVALRPPAEIRTRLTDLMEGVAGARWQEDDQLHLTLRFIGEVDGRAADDALAALAGVRQPPLTLALSGVGSFAARGRPNALWAGVTPHPPLAHLHKKLDQALVRAGLEPERRAYLPHITLARMPRSAGPVEPFLARHAGLASPAFTIGHFGLYESHIGQGGASYELVERFAME